MARQLLASFLAGLLVTKARAACSSNLIIDDFSKWSTNTNSLGQRTSDDGTMTNTSSSATSLTFTPTANSYLFENVACEAAATDGYTALSFTASVQDSASGYVSIELQSSTSCSNATYTSSYFTVTGVTGLVQTVTVPLSFFSDANIDGIRSFLWYGFSSVGTSWQIGDVQLVCNGSSSSTIPVPSSTSTISTSTTVSSSSVDSTSTVISASILTSTEIPTSAVSITTTDPASTADSTSTIIPTSGVLSLRTDSSVASTATTALTASPTGCTNLLIDDWESQSRLTFLYYNAMLQPSSDDLTMKSIVVSQDNHVTITPNSSSSYFYTETTCVNTKDTYGGISLPITAPAGTTFGVQLGSPDTCANGTDSASIYVTSTDLGWSFNGTERLYSIPFSKFTGLDLTKVRTLLFDSLTNAVTFGPMAFYCGETPSKYVVPTTTVLATPTATIVAPKGTKAALVIDNFASNSSQDTNSLGFWHGCDDGMSLTYGNKSLTIKSDDPDYGFYTQISDTCTDISSYDGSYLHIAYSGSNKFSIALEQHNSQCNTSIAPYPETWDSLEVARYSSATDIYMPMSHFKINQTRAVGFSFLGFYSTDSTIISRIEIVPEVPAGFTIPAKLPSGNLIFACTRPNSFAFAIDDGDPTLAQQVMQTVKDEGIKVTFFTVGAPLDDGSTNLTNVYNEMMDAGHQIALHSFTHPKMEGLPSYEAIDWEYNNDVAAVKKAFNGLHTPYFRPPFGTEGARMRQRLAVALETDDPYIVNWSVDVEDWIWALTDTPEKQLDAFKRDLAKGGNLVVMHYLYPTTVGYLKQFIQLAKATGKQLMRVDQCMEDPNAPPL